MGALACGTIALSVTCISTASTTSPFPNNSAADAKPWNDTRHAAGDAARSAGDGLDGGINGAQMIQVVGGVPVGRVANQPNESTRYTRQ